MFASQVLVLATMGLQQEDGVAGVGGVSDFTNRSDQLGKSLFEATLLV